MRVVKYSKPLRATSGLIVAICVLLYACKEKYLPEIKYNAVNYLVVEGLINTGVDSTIFTLSRTFKLNNKPIEAPEKGAIVQVESETGATYILPALLKAGRYGSPALGFDPTKRYRLRIRTTDKREYLSEFVESKTSPPFDLKYDFNDGALNFHINTSDPSGKSIYYKHSYEETWEYESQLKSLYKINDNGNIVLRNLPQEDIFTCWRTLPSPNILLSSTANLSEDRLINKLILSIPGSSPKLDVEYSILIRQTVLTREGFNFYEALRNNTENVGTIFDVQPSQLFGNIKSTTDPTETVIGFIGAGTIVEKRFLIQLPDLPTEWFSQPDKSECEESVSPILILKASGATFIPITGGSGTDRLYCADCRLLGGTKQRPSYWK